MLYATLEIISPGFYVQCRLLVDYACARDVPRASLSCQYHRSHEPSKRTTNGGCHLAWGGLGERREAYGALTHMDELREGGSLRLVVRGAPAWERMRRNGHGRSRPGMMEAAAGGGWTRSSLRLYGPSCRTQERIIRDLHCSPA